MPAPRRRSRQIAAHVWLAGRQRANGAQTPLERLRLAGEQAGVVGGIRQHLLHVVARFGEGDVLGPDGAWIYWKARAQLALARSDADRAAPRTALERLAANPGSSGFYEKLAREELGQPLMSPPPPAPLTARNPEGCIYMGSFSKVLAPGLRLGFVVAPKAVYPKLLQAKQAADLHTPGFNQRVVAEVIKDGFLDQHVPTIRARYHAQRDAMLAALARELGPTGAEWTQPVGGMFVWVRLPERLTAQALLPKAVDAGMAFVPGAPFYCAQPDLATLRLSFATADVDKIREGVARLAKAL